MTYDYRPDIYGLRGVAVLAVMVFHAGESWLPGGFVGVDVFFVISGFLITRLLLADQARGAFSFADFYRRRIKRLAPAALIVIGATLVAAQCFLLPEDAQAVAGSALSSLVGLANVHFWWFADTGYFAPDARHTPLLHLWSLAVEEQFYLLWPAVLVVVSPARLRWLLLPLALLSFGLGSVFFDVARAPYFISCQHGRENVVRRLAGVNPHSLTHGPGAAPTGCADACPGWPWSARLVLCVAERTRCVSRAACPHTHPGDRCAACGGCCAEPVFCAVEQRTAPLAGAALLFGLPLALAGAGLLALWLRGTARANGAWAAGACDRAGRPELPLGGTARAPVDTPPVAGCARLSSGAGLVLVLLAVVSSVLEASDRMLVRPLPSAVGGGAGAPAAALQLSLRVSAPASFAG